MLDSGKLNPATVIVPLLPVDAGEPPPDDPQALPMRLSPRIEDIRALKAHLRIAFPPGRTPAPASGAYETETRTKTRADGQFETKVRERRLERPFAKGYQVAGSATGAAARTACLRSPAAAERRPAGVSARWSSASTSSAAAESTTTSSAPAKTCT